MNVSKKGIRKAKKMKIICSIWKMKVSLIMSRVRMMKMNSTWTWKMISSMII